MEIEDWRLERRFPVQSFHFHSQKNLENMSTSDIISTYVYRVGLAEGMQYSFSTAVGLFQSIVSLLLLTVVNWLSRTVSETSLW